MSEILIRPGQLDSTQLEDDWLLVFGGASPAGNRRARRAVQTANAQGRQVIWFDAFEERSDIGGPRVPLALKRESGTGPVFIIAEFGPDPSPAGGRRWRSSLLNKLYQLWTRLWSKIRLVFAPLMGWLRIRRQVTDLIAANPPSRIVYCDDYSLTSAWHAARLWPQTRVSMGYEEK